MIIVIDDYGVSVEQEKGCFRISKGEEKRSISPHRVTGIQIRKTSMVSTAALMLAAEHGIPFLMYDTAGKVRARVWRPQFGSHVAVRHGQMDAARGADGLAWVREGLVLKAEGQMSVLRWLADRVSSKAEACAEAMAQLQEAIAALQAATLSDEGLRSAEAHVGRIYWEGYFAALEHREAAEKRSRRPAADPLNALINYGYGMLYGEVESATLTAGLDPHIGFLHRDEYGKPSFVFDAIEPYRPWVDRLVAALVLDEVLNSTWFDAKPSKRDDDGGSASEKSGYWLSREGKRAFIPAWVAMMQEQTLYGGKKIKRRDKLQARLTALAQGFLKGEKSEKGGGA